ncbi:transposase [Paenibacillus sp.]|uniref:transposase n=1 Tax=Paenibacillus sp. TaxID=58172 RepID=UPI0039C957B4
MDNNSHEHDLAFAAYITVKAKTNKLYPKEIKSWEEQYTAYLTFNKSPATVNDGIHTSNPIERVTKKL